MSLTNTDRVRSNTPEHVNRTIREDMMERLAYLARHPARIEARLDELDRECDIERALEANAAGFVLAGLTLAKASDRRWLALPGLVGVFLMQHAVQGWCPPLPVLRRLGFRTQQEIEQERHALKTLRNNAQKAEDEARRREGAPTAH